MNLNSQCSNPYPQPFRFPPLTMLIFDESNQQMQTQWNIFHIIKGILMILFDKYKCK